VTSAKRDDEDKDVYCYQSKSKTKRRFEGAIAGVCVSVVVEWGILECGQRRPGRSMSEVIFDYCGVEKRASGERKLRRKGKSKEQKSRDGRLGSEVV
jgi:hypothetical protein